VDTSDLPACATQLGRTCLLLGGRADDEAQRRRLALLARYHEAVFRYYLAALGDAGAAHRLYLSFALHLLDSLPRPGWPPGPFRLFLKELLGRHPPAAPRPNPAARGDPTFDAVWRQELLNQTWKALALREGHPADPLYRVLRGRSEHPDWGHQRLAAWAGLSGNAAHRVLHRALAAFAELLLEEVARTLGDPDEADLKRELTELQLLPYCRQALRQGPPARGGC
jgi:RNA polymerase sigma-70 factor (ECF subfamily)